ncbi:hypothetical protein BSZ39_04025 [Bowdeniella nasicola]|uniref:Uncharacterized protein n=1 Tax=Bowdeniella nasicola TaxID=208480 RepID=A0A1Q5Q3V4_9ACTO|nr:hypothetical protein [Bowdeniella nasicola]OKL54475.1 hypothetical protein BSZ39_04025 [Bowdeniella nasicola]
MFVSFGIPGLIGAVLAAALFALMCMVILQLGSYYRAHEHSVVFGEIAHPIISKLLDYFITFTLFCVGLVMIAGAGSNLNQQFGLPVWVGSAIMTALCIGAGLLDVSRLETVIGALTPFIIVIVVAASAVAINASDRSFAALQRVATEIPSSLPHWTLSSINYVALALALGISMAIVMDGDQLDPKSAGRGGFVGGLLFGGLLVIATLALFMQVGRVAHQPTELQYRGRDCSTRSRGARRRADPNGSSPSSSRLSRRDLPEVSLGSRRSWATSTRSSATSVSPSSSSSCSRGESSAPRSPPKRTAAAASATSVGASCKKRYPSPPAEHRDLEQAISDSNLDDDQIRTDMRAEVVEEIEADPDATLDTSQLPKELRANSACHVGCHCEVS